METLWTTNLFQNGRNFAKFEKFSAFKKGGHSVVVVHPHTDLTTEKSSNHGITTILADHSLIP